MGKAAPLAMQKSAHAPDLAAAPRVRCHAALEIVHPMKLPPYIVDQALEGFLSSINVRPVSEITIAKNQPTTSGQKPSKP
jgi:hypothetical protein